MLRARIEKAALPAVTVAAVLLLAGCVTREEIMLDVQQSRARAYENWARRTEADREMQTWIEGELGLDDAMKLAVTHNKELLAVAQEKDIAEGRILESYSEALPSVTGTVNYNRLDRVGGFDIGGRRVSLGFLNNYSAGLEVRQPIYRGGAISAAVRAARVFSLLSDQTVRAQYQQTIYEAAASYFETLLAQQLYEANRDAVESARAQLREVQARQAQGMASEFDVLRAQVDVSNFEAEMIQQQNRVNLAKTRLFKAMGVSQRSEVVLSDELTYNEYALDPMQAVETAFKNRPDLYQAELGMRLQAEALNVAEGRYWPNIDGTFFQDWARPDPHNSTLDEWGDAWQAGLSLEWPLFTGFSREGQVRQERARLIQRRYELANSQEVALLEVQQALLSLDDSKEFVQSQTLNLKRAREGLRLAEIGYRQGVRTEIEVTDARAALTRARSLYYQAIYDHTIARLNLQRAMGVLGEMDSPGGYGPQPGSAEPAGPVDVPANRTSVDGAVRQPVQENTGDDQP